MANRRDNDDLLIRRPKLQHPSRTREPRALGQYVRCNILPSYVGPDCAGRWLLDGHEDQDEMVARYGEHRLLALLPRGC